ncbi:MAG: head maturation protease, ClpP-related [Cetobacterium sp.]|uniref:head maturation protease, ClpP-related n=1 Tax=Cetobacterium sp. TaxID=2071632 RepID=UPI003F40E2AE
MSPIFNLYKTGEKKATILLYGVIGDTFSEEGVSEKELAEELLEHGDIDELTVRINSPGGLVTAGIAIYNTLKNHKAKKTVEIDGLCGSIATVIAMCGEKRIMNAGTRFMIHNPLTMAFGGIKELEKSIERLNQIKDDVVEIYSSATKLGKEELEKMMDEEPYLKPEEALAKGFITDINKNADMNITNYVQEYINYTNIKKNKKKEDEIVTKEELKVKFPQVYNEVLEEGEKKERERIKKLDDFSNNAIVTNVENAGEIIKNAKYVNVKSLEEVSTEILLNGKIKPVTQEENLIQETTGKDETNPLDFKARVNDAYNLTTIEGSTQMSEDEKRKAFLAAWDEI